jgi:hypothetical protein
MYSSVVDTKVTKEKSPNMMIAKILRYDYSIDEQTPNMGGRAGF